MLEEKETSKYTLFDILPNFDNSTFHGKANQG